MLSSFFRHMTIECQINEHFRHVLLRLENAGHHVAKLKPKNSIHDSLDYDSFQLLSKSLRVVSFNNMKLKTLHGQFFESIIVDFYCQRIDKWTVGKNGFLLLMNYHIK